MTTPKDKFRDDLIEVLKEHHQGTRNRDLVDVLYEIKRMIEMGTFEWEDGE